MSEPKSRALWDRGAGCLGKLETASSALWARVQAVLKRCRNLPPRHSGAGVQAV